MAIQDTELAAGSPTVRLGGNFEILPAEPAGEFCSPTAEAYRAAGRDYPGANLFALICDPDQPPRRDLIEPLGPLYVDGLMRPLAWGVVDWPRRGRRCFAVVFEEPGSRLVEALSETISPFTEDEVLTLVLPSVIAALKALHGLGHAHRAVRASNLFRRLADRRIVLGECVSGPPGAAQPFAYEPIERALADVAGRGAGGPADDLYALGVTLIFLLEGSDPTADIDDNTLLSDKMNRGSLAALLGATRPPAHMLEAIRGLVNDDPRERWTLPDLEAWLRGRRLSSKQITLQRRAGRPLELGGVGHQTARSLAHAMAQDPAAAAKLIKSGVFEAWVQRSLGDPERAAAVVQAMADAPENGSQETRVVARVVMALDPQGPVRCGEVAVALDGFGTALAAACRAGVGAPAIAGAIVARLPQFWFGLQGAFKPDQAPQLKTFDRMRQYLEDRRPSFGIERVLYELNHTLNCLSPAIERDYVLEPGDVLAALERAVAGGRVGEILIDRHIAAFIAARWRNAGSDWQDRLASSEPMERALGTLHLLARLQKLRGPAAVPAIVERLALDAPTLIDRYHSRARRTRLKVALGKLAGTGNLIELHAIVAGHGDQQRDRDEFIAARREFADVEQSLVALREGEAARHHEAVLLGGRIGVGVAVMLAWVAALGSLLIAG